MSEALGNIVDRATVGQATRRDANGGHDGQSLEAEVAAMIAAKLTLSDKKREQLARLTEIKSQMARTLPRGEYETLERERAKLGRQSAIIDGKLREINGRLRPLQSELFTEQNGAIGYQIAELRREVAGLKNQIRELVQLVRRGGVE